MDAAAIQSELIECGVAARPLPGEICSGDAHVMQPFPGGVLVAAVDGLGHGSEAAEAAAAATDILTRNAHEPPVSLVRRCHEGLVGTRGVAMSLASFAGSDHTMSWLGVGNVDASLIRGGPGPRIVRETLIMRGGVVGYRLPMLRPSVISVGPGDVLVLATDGIGAYSLDARRLAGPPVRIAKDILAGFARDADDALVLVARYRGEAA
jgi:negative regulator of sigma-B (phosphoserine phosphatase)